MSFELNIENKTSEAIKLFWETKQNKGEESQTQGGSRGENLSGKHLDGFIHLLTEVLVAAGISPNEIFYGAKMYDSTLAGYFRATKNWDFIVVKKDRNGANHLLVAIELKSQVGSYGNNHNNRIEESLGSSVDLFHGTQEGGRYFSLRLPWVGYLLVLCDEDDSAVRIAAEKFLPLMQQHFSILDEFKDSTYAQRYAIFCRKAIRHRYYNSACLLLSEKDRGKKDGSYRELSADLGIHQFIRSLAGHIQQELFIMNQMELL